MCLAILSSSRSQLSAWCGRSWRSGKFAIHETRSKATRRQTVCTIKSWSSDCFASKHRKRARWGSTADRFCRRELASNCGETVCARRRSTERNWSNSLRREWSRRFEISSNPGRSNQWIVDDAGASRKPSVQRRIAAQPTSSTTKQCCQADEFVPKTENDVEWVPNMSSSCEGIAYVRVLLIPIGDALWQERPLERLRWVHMVLNCVTLPEHLRLQLSELLPERQVGSLHWNHLRLQQLPLAFLLIRS